MSLINNQITDLMDRLITLNASDLSIEANQKPAFLKAGKFILADDVPMMDIDELIEDMKALGMDITTMRDGYYIHTIDDGLGIEHKIRVAMSTKINPDEYFIVMRYISSFVPPSSIPAPVPF
jgi:Tfp pilus assembly pilus retraction ATPase PilT